MARKRQKDLITRLAEAGEEALDRLQEVPGGQRVLEATHVLRDRVDEVAKRLRKLDPLEKRVAALERRLAALERTRKPAAARKPPAKRSG